MKNTPYQARAPFKLNSRTSSSNVYTCLSVVGDEVRQHVVGVYVAQPVLHPELNVCQTTRPEQRAASRRGTAADPRSRKRCGRCCLCPEPKHTQIQLPLQVGFCSKASPAIPGPRNRREQPEIKVARRKELKAVPSHRYRVVHAASTLNKVVVPFYFILIAYPTYLRFGAWPLP